MHGSDDNRSITSTEVRVPEYIDMNNKNKVLTYNKQQKYGSDDNRSVTSTEVTVQK
jgi:hypothetical protein